MSNRRRITGWVLHRNRRGHHPDLRHHHSDGGFVPEHRDARVSSADRHRCRYRLFVQPGQYRWRKHQHPRSCHFPWSGLGVGPHGPTTFCDVELPQRGLLLGSAATAQTTGPTLHEHGMSCATPSGTLDSGESVTLAFGVPFSGAVAWGAVGWLHQFLRCRYQRRWPGVIRGFALLARCLWRLLPNLRMSKAPNNSLEINGQ